MLKKFSKMITATVGVSALALSGCWGDTEPSPEPMPSPTSSIDMPVTMTPEDEETLDVPLDIEHTMVPVEEKPILPPKNSMIESLRPSDSEKIPTIQELEEKDDFQPAAEPTESPAEEN